MSAAVQARVTLATNVIDGCGQSLCHVMYLQALQQCIQKWLEWCVNCVNADPPDTLPSSQIDYDRTLMDGYRRGLVDVEFDVTPANSVYICAI